MSLDTNAVPTARVLDLEGLQIGLWLVTSRAGLMSGKNWAWNTQCAHCESLAVHLATHLIAGRRQTCKGCPNRGKLTPHQVRAIENRRVNARKKSSLHRETKKKIKKLRARIEKDLGEIVRLQSLLRETK